jgi:outer membrane autotransporter protein
MPYPQHRLALAITLLSLGAPFSLAYAKTIEVADQVSGLSLNSGDTLSIGTNGAIIDSGKAIKFKGTATTGVVVDNSGSILSTGNRAIDFDDLRGAGVATTIYNRATGTIDGGAGDGMKTGDNLTLYNDGKISTGDSLTADDKYDAIDVDSASGVVVYNSGTVSGGRHGMTTDEGATLYNYGSMTGRNGSGYGSDGNGTVINHGTISGEYAGLRADGDGDGVDIDKLGHIENYGIIRGTGAGGVDKNGFANGSEGVALGGGYVLNAAGALISGADNAVLVDDGSGGSGLSTTWLENHGVIQGLNGFGIQLNGDFADTVINSGLISGSNGLALGMGGGDDQLVVQSGGRFAGRVDGGSGYDRLTLDGAGGGSFGSSQNFEWLQVAQGAWTLTGNGDFSNGGLVAGGASLTNLGAIAGNLIVDKGATYAGGGSVGSLQVNGTLLTNSALGSATVVNDLTLGSGATLAYGVNADGSSAPLQVGGTAYLNGATLAVNPSNGEYPWQSHYTVLQAGTIDGTFGKVTSDYAFLTPTLSYSAHEVGLDYTRNDIAFANYASTANGARAASSLAGLSQGTLYNALLNTSSSSAGSAIEQLAGSSNASLGAATLAASAQVGSSMLSAMQHMGSTGGLQAGLSASDTPVLAANGVPSAARNLNDPNARGRLWVQGLGSYGKLDGEHGSSGLEQRTRGGVLGSDFALAADWRLGVLGGYSRTDLDASRTDGKVDSWHMGIYAQRQSGPLALRLGAAYSQHDGSSKRSVGFDGFSERLRGDYDADSQQAFVELGYALGSGRLSAEPFANLGYQRYHRDAYQEKGGAAALQVEGQTQDNFISTFGVRLAQLNQLENGMSLTPRLSLGWRHAYGDVDSTTRQAFVSGGSAFSIEGTALDRDSLLVETGLDLGISARQSIGVGYSGDLGSNSRNHALIGQWQVRF